MAIRNYLAGTIFMVLLIWGPIDHSWPAWLVIRTGYLILIPLAVWLLISWVWNHWQPTKKSEIILERVLLGMIYTALLVFAILEAISKTHIGNTESIQTRDGIEDVGGEIVLQGPNWGNVFILVIIAMLVLWFGVLRKDPKTSNS